jgi:hypothetical protein
MVLKLLLDIGILLDPGIIDCTHNILVIYSGHKAMMHPE